MTQVLKNASLADQPLPDYGALWIHLRRLLERFASSLDHDAFLDECLDAVVELLGADRGVLMRVDANGASHVVNARRLGAPLPPGEWEELSRSLVRKVLETGEPQVWSLRAPSVSGESLYMLRISAAMAAPLRGTDGIRGVLYTDVRDLGKKLGDLHREFFETAAALLALAAVPVERLAAVSEDLRTARLAVDVDGRPPTLDEFLGYESLRPVRTEVLSALDGDSPILIGGESGTGKTLLARAIAEASVRRPVVRAMLGSSEDLNTITSELFGHERGAYSGAATRRVGVVEHADGGTLILDELLNLPPHAQQLLLDFTQFGSYRPLGYDGAEPKRARVRIISSTNGDLAAAIRAGRFREDLYYRLAAVRIDLPPLRARRGDAAGLAEAYLRRLDPDRDWHLALELRRRLTGPDLAWPGNVRQLESCVRRVRERALAEKPEALALELRHLHDRDLGLAEALPASGSAVTSAWHALQAERSALDERERQVLERALGEHHQVVAHAAAALGIPRTTLASRLKALGLARG